MTSVIIALLGGAAITALTLAVWSPVRAREVSLRRRVEWFVVGSAQRQRLVIADPTARLRRQTRRPDQGGRFLRAVDLRVTKAQLEISADRLVGLVALLAFLAFWVGLLFGGPMTGGMAAGAVPVLTSLWLSRKAAGVQSKFADQLAETVPLLASSVRAGQSVQQALEHVTQEAPEPTRSAFGLVVREVGLGASVEDALARLVERYPSEDMELLTTVISIQSAVGGSLGKILDTVADTIRERRRLKAEVSALTSQQRYSAYVLALMPIILLVVMRLISPDYAGELFKPELRIALVAAGALIGVGFVVMRRIADIDA